MWSRVVVLLLCLPVCRSVDYVYPDPAEGEAEYADSYDGEVVTMAELPTTTPYQKYMKVDINQLLLTADPRLLGFRLWPINSTVPGSTVTEDWRSVSESSTKASLTATTSTTELRVRRDQQHWESMDSGIDEIGKYLRQGEDTKAPTPPKPTTTTVTTTTTTVTTTTEPWYTYAEGVHTYWAGNRPRTYPRSILVNGTWHMLPPDWPFMTTVYHTCPTLTPPPRPTTTTVKPTLRLDIVGLLDLIANLTYEYDMNLTERFNETLIKYSVPTCPTPTTTATPTPTTPVYDFTNATIVGKCFVCGLDKEAIPQDAYCADAFAGDFLPLVPIDPRARGQIARYRKYCRFLDVRHYELNPDEPRAVYGRFTGGCSVRWTDLSGVYTQRTCRNKRRAVLGKHFASKRMAKLEMALNHLDNGCIISPMATLLPLSRGVSLYARFHACVCTGAWCNRAVRNEQWILNVLLPLCFYTYR